jgi:hypothetical protein
MNETAIDTPEGAVESPDDSAGHPTEPRKAAPRLFEPPAPGEKLDSHNTRAALLNQNRAILHRQEGSAVNVWFANEADEFAANILTLPEKPIVGTGGELSLEDNPIGLRSTVDNPDAVNALASRDRLTLAADANCLDLAADTAETIQAKNSLEKMLAHQMAAAHVTAMKLAAQSQDMIEKAQFSNNEKIRDSRMLNATRLVNASGRMMDAFQKGAETLRKLRTGGKQTVVVQHVHVTNGGQAVVAGTVDKGGSRGGG